MAATRDAGITDTYMELIGEFPLRRIKSGTAHAKAKKLALRLSSQDADRGTSEYLDVLIDLIADYERRMGQTLDTAHLSIAELVQHRMLERAMSISSLARLIGIPQSNLSEMLSGKRDWSKTAIRGLVSHLNIRADRFLV
jgi:antitoxin component HigA of HigAB toxin-antitoxin module